VLVWVGGGDSGSRPKSELGVTTGVGAGAMGGATLLGAAITGLATAFLAAGAALAGAFFAAALAGARFGAAFFAFLATFRLLGFFDARAFFFVTLDLAAARFAFATGRFFPLPFFFAMVSLLLAILRLLVVRVVPKKSAVICA
jgi:hypothetical protein